MYVRLGSLNKNCRFLLHVGSKVNEFHRGPTGAAELVSYSAPRDLHRRAAYSIFESSFLIQQYVYHDLFV